ncbi:MAG: 16S rRNA (cytidine(1402)-2'-O)-methyltransferase [Lachnospiraceae bacterium]|nr:16S rRNA (cytidine(1402)-2'-O)-methyltransferase [Lachnospiraceae bacterium]
MLYLCATPIGNLDDMTFRVINILKEVDLIAAEDTRNSIKLLNHFDIHTPMTAYHEFNKVEKAKELVKYMLEGKSVAVITDAGTPGISDPGEELARQARAAGIQVTSVPGACACITALTMSGLPTRRFCFEAFLPTDKKECRRVLDELKDETRTIVMYEAPHRLLKTLQLLLDELGDRQMTVTKELTKKHESSYEGKISEHIAFFTANEPKGEYVLVIAGRSFEELEQEAREQWEDVSLEEHVQMYLDKGMDKKEAMKAVAQDRGISKRDVYNALLEKG